MIKQKETKKTLTTDDSEASDKCESPPIVPGNTDTQMVDDIASDSESTSTTNDSKASDKCESPLIVPGSTAARMLEIFEQKFEHRFTEILTERFSEFEKVVDEIGERVDVMIHDEERWRVC